MYLYVIVGKLPKESFSVIIRINSCGEALFMPTEWLTVEQIAKELKVAEGTVRGWIRDKKLKGAKFGRDYRIRREDYDKFVNERLNPDNTDKEQ